MADDSLNPWPKRRKPRDTQYNEKREAVIVRATSMFAERGFDAVSLSDLADSLNITKPTLYYYIKSKDEVLLEIKHRAQDMVWEAIDKADASGKTGLDKLRAFLRLYVDIVASDFVRVLIVVGARHLAPSSRQKIQGRAKEADARIRSFFTKGMRDGSIRKQDETIAYQSIFGMVNSTVVWYHEDGPVKRDQMAEQIIRIIVEGVGGPKA